MLCCFVVDQIAITRSPSDIMDVTEGVDDEDVHECWQHESNKQRSTSPYKYWIIVGRIEKS